MKKVKQMLIEWTLQKLQTSFGYTKDKVAFAIAKLQEYEQSI